MKYRAHFSKKGNMIHTRFHETKEDAQDALAKRIGHFHHLGKVSGDTTLESYGYCPSAPRNGGLVSIEEREAQ
jgi:hypothetical protein